MNKIVRVSLVALMVGISLVFVNCSKDGKWDDYNKKGKVYDFTVQCLDSVFAEKAIGEATTIRINLNTRYDFKTLKMRAKVIYNSGKGRLRNELGRTFEPNIDYLVNEPNNVFEYVGNDEGTHKFTIEFFNDRGVKKEEVVTINYATMTFYVETPKKITDGDIYQGDECEYQFCITPRKETDPINNYEIKFNEFDGDIEFNSSPTKKNKWYDIASISNFKVKLMSVKSGDVTLHYSIKNATSGEKVFSFQHKVKQRRVIARDVNINNTTIVRGSTGNFISGKIQKEPQTTSKIFYRVQLKNFPTNYNASAINIDVSSDYKEGVLMNNEQWKFPLEIRNNATPGKYKIGVIFKDEYNNFSEEKDFEIDVLSGEPAWVIELRSAIFDMYRYNQYWDIAKVDTKFSVVSNVPGVIVERVECWIVYYFDQQCGWGQKKYHVMYKHLHTPTEGLGQESYELNNFELHQKCHCVIGSISQLYDEQFYVKVFFSNGKTLEKGIKATSRRTQL